jgi:hypothetical protein
MAISRDDHVIVDSDAKQVANLDHLLGHVDIGPGWRGVAGRVVVDENAAGGVQFDGSPQYLAWIHGRSNHMLPAGPCGDQVSATQCIPNMVRFAICGPGDS